MNKHLHAKHRVFLLLFPLLLILAGCEINDFDGDPNSEYRESFLFTKAVGARSELFISNVNGAVMIIGVDTLNEVRISGSKIVKDQSDDEARRHIVDIEIDMQESPSTLTIKTLQPNTSGRRTYQVNYEVMIPSSWRVTVSNVNGNVDIQNIRNTVSTMVVNGTVNATEIAGNVSVTVTNGVISGKVQIPENGSCAFNLVNGNATLLVPRTTSASVTATVTLGTVSVSNLPIVYSMNTRTSVTGVVGAGKGTIRLSSVNGVVQLLGY